MELIIINPKFPGRLRGNVLNCLLKLLNGNATTATFCIKTD